MNDKITPDLAELQTQVAALVHQATGHTDLQHIQSLSGGGNNRVFRIDLPNRSVLLKLYFRHEYDQRDRLSAEFAFARFAWDYGLRCLAEPLAHDSPNRLGLYEFVVGRMPQPADLSADHIAEALAFYLDLNRHKLRPDAEILPDASEACFTLSDHLTRVERRIANLYLIEATSEIERATADFILGPLSVQWKHLADYVRKKASEHKLDIFQPLAKEDRCLSPSDFGFHNAVIADDNRLRFIDFEYAGWDDPAKLVCDFFCQPAVPVPLSFFTLFADQVAHAMSEPRSQRARIGMLLPVYQIKWCCIMLNDFLPIGNARRHFARSQSDLAKRKQAQLEKAQAALQRLPTLLALAAEQG